MENRHPTYELHLPIFDEEAKKVRIPLRNKFGEIITYASADISDAVFLLQFCYSAHKVDKKKKTEYYARSNIDNKSMHQLLMGDNQPPNTIIDHIDGNKLNNCRSNLRFATSAQNAQNREKREGCLSKYLGVSVHKSGKWSTGMSTNGKHENYGLFDSEYHAAMMYDIHRIHTMGPGVKTNGTLDQEIIDWIVKNGIPPGFERKVQKRDLPKNIVKTVIGHYAFKKTRKGVEFSKTVKTLEEAIALKEKIEAQWAAEEKEAHDNRTIERNNEGLAVIYIIKGEDKFVVIVDDNMWHDLSRLNWILSNDGYAMTRKIEGEYSMHRYVWTKIKGTIPDGYSIDHIKSEQKLDNRICNLRLADRKLQSHNQAKKSSFLDKYRGVEFRGNDYLAVIGKETYGPYKSAEEAAKRANEEFTRIYGDDASLNIIDWSKTTTAENRITLDMINREFIEKLSLAKDFKNLIRVLGLNVRSGGTISVANFKGKHIPEFRKWLLDTYFPEETRTEN